MPEVEASWAYSAHDTARFQVKWVLGSVGLARRHRHSITAIAIVGPEQPRWRNPRRPGAMSAMSMSRQASKNAKREANKARDKEKEESLARKQRDQYEQERKYTGTCSCDDTAKDLQVVTISAPADTISA